eukprot:COSAG06_NODE_67301_length_252_cov_0.679739_1_plen_33_part_10
MSALLSDNAVVVRVVFNLIIQRNVLSLESGHHT